MDYYTNQKPSWQHDRLFHRASTSHFGDTLGIKIPKYLILQNTTRIRILMVLVTFMLISAVSGCKRADTDGVRTIILAHAMHPTHPVSVAMQMMADSVSVFSDGKLNLKIYPSGQLGSERKLLELMQIGMVGMTKVSAATMENIVPAMRVFNLPYLFDDKAHILNVWDGQVGQDLLDEGLSYRIKGMAYYDAGSRSIYTVNRPIHTPADLRGLKLRVMESVTAMRLMRLMGGNPTPLAWGELYTAFQGGIVDGAENNPPSFLSSRHYEVCKFYTMNEHSSIPDLLVMDPNLWNDLTDDEQNWLSNAIELSVEFQRKLWTQTEVSAMKRFEEAGVTIIYPDKSPFIEASKPLYDVIRETDPELYTWVERIRNAKPEGNNAGRD